MMTLDEAIIHCEDVANDRAGCCEDCAEEHRQLAEWLKELKAYKEQMDTPRVTCATCKHYNEHPVGMLAVERWCRSPIWERAGRAPHPINHDRFKLIMCDYYERMEGQNNGTV